jgi:hypothetical protein
MSMNLNVEATITTVHETLGEFEVSRTFELWQTPTKVTTRLLSYKTNSEIVDAYETWCDRNDPGFHSLEHIKMLKQWLQDHKEWNILFYEM